ncbi:MAG: ArsA-related P-loop ATPase [Polyangiales bacterium]
MISIAEDRTIVFCVGVGGVGKTTFSAGLALREALAGRSVLVLTADPARRLADALGIDALSDEPSRISLPDGSAGELHAAMLETKASADAIIRRATDDDARAKRVLDNKIYQAFSNTLARSHAYAAMERVHQAVHDPQYDLVIVDTPPAQSALEILDAPARLVRFLDQRVVRWFLSPSDDAPRLRGGALTRRLLATIAGDSLLTALTGFLSEMAFLREGFAERARDVRDRMRSADTEFVLVASADAMGVQAARSVADEIGRRGFSLGHAVFNRGFIPVSTRTQGTLSSYPAEIEEHAPTLVEMIAWARAEQAQRRAAVVEFQDEYAPPVWVLPESMRPLGDITALSAWIREALPAKALA